VYSCVLVVPHAIDAAECWRRIEVRPTSNERQRARRSSLRCGVVVSERVLPEWEVGACVYERRRAVSFGSSL
jgi:hypothetical protein